MASVNLPKNFEKTNAMEHSPTFRAKRIILAKNAAGEDVYLSAEAIPDTSPVRYALETTATIEGDVVVDNVKTVSPDGATELYILGDAAGRPQINISKVGGNDTYSLVNLVDTTNLLAGTYYYPGANGDTVDSYGDLSISGILTNSTGTITMTVEVTNDEVLAGANWVAIAGYDMKNSVMVTSQSAVSTSKTFAWDFGMSFANYRVKIVTDTTADVVIIKGRLALA